MKVALVYDRVNKWGGAERVLLVLHEMFPEAPLYTSVYDKRAAGWARVFPKVIPSFLQNIPFAKNNHELLGFLMPLAFESFNFDEYDLVISVTSESAKGIITQPHTKHICICLTPTRYLWSGYKEYLHNPPSKLSWIPFYKYVSKPFIGYVRRWDQVSSQRPDEYIAISSAVQERIRKYYGRDSTVIFPPVEIENFVNQVKTTKQNNDDFYLFVSRLIPYKKADLAINAFNKLGYKLVVVGRGSEETKLKRMAKSNIKFISYLADSDLADYYKKAKALIFPAEEDFGIVMVEALASGTPVIAFKKGGSLDIVKNNINGILFDKQSVAGIKRAVQQFDKNSFSKKNIMGNVQNFTKKKFRSRFLKIVDKLAVI